MDAIVRDAFASLQVLRDRAEIGIISLDTVSHEKPTLKVVFDNVDAMREFYYALTQCGRIAEQIDALAPSSSIEI